MTRTFDKFTRDLAIDEINHMNPIAREDLQKMADKAGMPIIDMQCCLIEKETAETALYIQENPGTIWDMYPDDIGSDDADLV